MNLCADCKFFVPCIADSNDGLCSAAHPDREFEQSKISGASIWKWQFSTTLRADGEHKCGQDAKWFEPK